MIKQGMSSEEKRQRESRAGTRLLACGFCGLHLADLKCGPVATEAVCSNHRLSSLWKPLGQWSDVLLGWEQQQLCEVWEPRVRDAAAILGDSSKNDEAKSQRSVWPSTESPIPMALAPVFWTFAPEMCCIISLPFKLKFVEFLHLI